MADQPWVVLDTDVWSWLYGSKNQAHPLAATWRELLFGRTVVIATQTRAEVLTWLARREMGERRSGAIAAQLESTSTVPVTEEIVQTYARLTVECRRLALGLHDKAHTGDRWVAATSIAIDAPLLAIDTVYRNAPGLRLLTGPGPSAFDARDSGL